MKKRKIYGMTLIEVVISIAIFSLLSIGFITTLIVSSRASMNVPLEVGADSYASKMIERMQLRNKLSIGDYDMLGDPAAPVDKSFLQLYNFPYDPTNPTWSVTFQVEIKFKGFGKVSSATNNTLTAVIPSGFPSWDTNEWQGDMVMIKKGLGSGQIAYILSNTNNTLTITRNLDGSPGSGWIGSPDTTSYFEINGGKSATINITWQYRQRTYSRQYRALIYHP